MKEFIIFVVVVGFPVSGLTIHRDSLAPVPKVILLVSKEMVCPMLLINGFTSATFLVIYCSYQQLLEQLCFSVWKSTHLMVLGTFKELACHGALWLLL